VKFAMFFGLFAQDPRLELLGWMHFTGSAVTSAFMVVMFLRNTSMRERYDGSETTLSNESTEPEDPAQSEESNQSCESIELPKSKSKGQKRQIVLDGFSAMLLDVSVQLGLSIGVYTAGAKMGIGPMYQISALQAAFPQYGIQYIMGLALIWKLRGAQFLGKRDFVSFSKFFKVLCLFATALAVCAFATLLPYRQPISFHLAENACEYAAEPGCLVVYQSVFGGGNAPESLTTIQGSAFTAFLPALVAVCYYRLFKAGLYVCNDWHFMAKAAAASFVVVFVPAFLIASLVIGNTTAIFVACYLPFLVLGIAFAVRTAQNIKKMLAGESGPWDLVQGPAQAAGTPSTPAASSATHA